MRFHNNEEITNYVNLFVSVIICFPEITTIKYDRDRDQIYFNFILKNADSLAKINHGLEKIYQAFACYRKMEDRDAYDFTVAVKSVGDYAVLEARRDMKTVTRPEITFLVELFRDAFLDQLLMESVNQEEENDYRWFQQDSDESAAETKRIKFDEKSIGNNILVCREAGKVLVFSNS